MGHYNVVTEKERQQRVAINQSYFERGKLMNKNTTDITLSSYFNDIVIGYYEDEDLVKQFGRQLGFDVDLDVFMAVSFQYPSDMRVTVEDREKMTAAAEAVIALSETNQKIAGKQIIACDSGVCVIMIAPNKSVMRKLQSEVKDTVIEEVKKINSERKIRVGIGTIEHGIKGIKNTYYNAQSAVRAGEVFKKERVVLEYLGMEIYSSINQMVVNYGDRLTRTVLKQLGETEKHVLSKYYKCKEDISLTAEELRMTEEEVKNSLQQVKINTGLDVNDTEDNFKLHFVMIAKKVLENDERIKRSH